MNRLPAWIIWSVALLIPAAFFRFALSGYSYIAHTLTFAVLLIVIHHFASPVLWRICCVFVAAGLLYFAVVEIPIIKNARTDDDGGRDWLIVLGAEVKGDVPSRSLRYRLNAALEYAEANPECRIIVSGGQGEGENISEAQCMYDFLCAKGISPERIITEDRSTSTEENLRYSFDIIRASGSEPDGSTAVVTSSYHLYRAKSIAARMGCKVAGVAAYPGWALLSANFFIREAFGVTRLWVLGR